MLTVCMEYIFEAATQTSVAIDVSRAQAASPNQAFEPNMTICRVLCQPSATTDEMRRGCDEQTEFPRQH